MFLDQVITVPTRGPSILDLCFTTHPSAIRNCYTIQGLSDYLVVIIDICPYSYYSKEPTRNVYLYKKANWEEIRERLSIISTTYFSLNTISTRPIEENWQFIKQNFLGLINSCLPSKQIRNYYHLPWMSVPLKCLIKKKQCVYNRGKLFQRQSNWKEYKDIQREVRNLLQNAHH